MARRGPRLQPSLNREVADAEVRGDLDRGQPASLQLPHGREALVTLFATTASQCLFLRQLGRRRDDAFGMTSMGDAAGSGMNLAAGVVHQFLQRVAEGAKKVPYVDGPRLAR